MIMGVYALMRECNLKSFAKLFFVTTLAFAAIPSDAQVSSNVAGKLSALLDLRPGEWRELPDTRMSSVFPQRDKTTWGVVGPDSVIIAWGGAAYDTKRNAFVFNGGGRKADPRAVR